MHFILLDLVHLVKNGVAGVAIEWTDENGVIELIFVLKYIHIHLVAGIKMP